MRTSASGFVAVAVCLGFLTQTLSAQQAATIYSSVKYSKVKRNSCLNFVSVPSSSFATSDCDIFYGTLSSGADNDWFQSSQRLHRRTLIKDLGPLSWTDRFNVPVLDSSRSRVANEGRSILFATSGSPLPTPKQVDRSKKVVSVDELRRETLRQPLLPKESFKFGVDPRFVKAQAGHLYAIHVVDDTSDFYALFRVDDIQPGDNCQISWRIVPAPRN